MNNLDRMREAIRNKPAVAGKIVPSPTGGKPTAKIGKVKRFDSHDETHRLPDGSEYHFRYSAADKKWSGRLTVPSPSGPLVFDLVHSGVLTLMITLDRRYRNSLQGMPQ